MTEDYIRLNYSENNSYDLRTIVDENELFTIVNVLYANNKNPNKIYVLNDENGKKIKELLIKSYNFNSNIFFFI